MFTQCPECGTIFAISAQVIAVAGTVFDSLIGAVRR